MFPWEPDPSKNLFILSVALMRAVRFAIHITPNHPVIQPILGRQNRETEFVNKLYSAVRTQPNNQNLTKNNVPNFTELEHERVGKRTVLNNVGQCTEHVTTVENLIKLFPIPSTMPNPVTGESSTLLTPPPQGKDVWCTVCRQGMPDPRDNHVFCLLHYNDNTFADTFARSYENNVPLQSIFGNSAVICDPWFVYVFYCFTDASNRHYSARFGNFSPKPVKNVLHKKLLWQNSGDQPWLERKTYKQAPNHLSYGERLEKYQRIYKPIFEDFLARLWIESSVVEQYDYTLWPYIISEEEQGCDLLEYLRSHPLHHE